MAAVIRTEGTCDMIVRRARVLSDALKQVGRLSFDPKKKIFVIVCNNICSYYLVLVQLPVFKYIL